MFKNIRKGGKAEAAQTVAPQEPVVPFKRDRTSLIVIQTSRGATEVKIHTFSAMDGWQAKTSAKNFYSTDEKLRQSFSTFALSHASIGGVRLDNEAAANDLLERWENVETVFRAVIDHNGIDLDAAAVLREDIFMFSRQFAKSFFAESERLIGPAMELVNKRGEQ